MFTNLDFCCFSWGLLAPNPRGVFWYKILYQTTLNEYAESKIQQFNFSTFPCPLFREQHLGYTFSDNFIRAEINRNRINYDTLEYDLMHDIEQTALTLGVKVLIVDNITYHSQSIEKGDAAGRLMIQLTNLKQKYNWSLLIIAHTPKRNLSSPITQNNLAGSKILYNFLDSAFVIGTSSKGQEYRYIKQIKVREGAFTYHEKNVLVCRLTSNKGFIHFQPVGTDNEYAHLTSMSEEERQHIIQEVLQLHSENKSLRVIADELGITHTRVKRIIDAHKKETDQADTEQTETE